MALTSAIEAISNRLNPTMPTANPDEAGDGAPFDAENATQCIQVVNHIIDLANQGSISRVVYGMGVILHEPNQAVDLHKSHIAHHPRRIEGCALLMKIADMLEAGQSAECMLVQVRAHLALENAEIKQEAQQAAAKITVQAASAHKRANEHENEQWQTCPKDDLGRQWEKDYK